MSLPTIINEKVINILPFFPRYEKNKNYYRLSIIFYLKKSITFAANCIAILENETELETWYDDLPAARAAGQLWGVARGV